MQVGPDELWELVQPRLRLYMTHTWDIETVHTVTDSTVQTATGWLTADQAPPGGRVIKLWHLFAALGYDSPELMQLPDICRLCGELYTFAGVDLAQIGVAMNIQKEQGVLRTLRGSAPMKPEYTVKQLRELYGEALEKGKARLPKVSIERDVSSTEMAVPVPAPVSAVVQTIAQGGDRLMMAAMLLNAALPLARAIDDDGSPEDRSYLRSIMGEEVMFKLNYHLTNLCGERARRNNQRK